MAEINVTLRDGLKIGEDCYINAVIREATAGDVIDASMESERVVPTEDGAELVSSPTAVGLHVLRRQIVRIGDLKGPLGLDDLRRLSAYDLNLLQKEALKLEQAAFKAVTQRGRTDEAGTGAGTGDP